MRSRIKIKTVVVVPENRLYSKRERTEMTLMSYGSNKLQQKFINHQHIQLLSTSI